MKSIDCFGDYLGKFNLITNDTTSTSRISSYNNELITVKTLSAGRQEFVEHIVGGINSFTSFIPSSGYIVFAKQPFVLQDFQSESIIPSIQFDGNAQGINTIFRYPFVNSLPISSYNSLLHEVKTTSKDNSILRTYIPTNSINPFTKFEHNQYYLLKAKSNFTIDNPDPSITADLQVGSISAGEVIPGGTKLQEFMEQLLRTIYEPIFVEPTLAAATSLSSTVEVGTTGLVLSALFDRGAIVGSVVGGIWNPLVAQNFRSGPATVLTLNSQNNGTTAWLNLPSYVIADGTNTLVVSATYSVGPQPLNNRNQSFSTPLPGATQQASVSVTGARRAFFGTSIGTINTVNIRNLQGSLLNPQKGSTFTINVPVNATNVVFAYPNTVPLGNVSKVIYIEGLGIDVKENFTSTTVQVSGLNNYMGAEYKVYTYTPVEPFGEEVNYVVTI